MYQHDALKALFQEAKGPAFSLRVNFLGLLLVVELRLSLPQLAKLWGFLRRVIHAPGKDGNGKDGSAIASRVGADTPDPSPEAH